MNQPITDKMIEGEYARLKQTCGGVKEDYFALLYLQFNHELSSEQAQNHVAFGGNDYGIDAFYFDREKRNLYLYQFKWSDKYQQFKTSFERLIQTGIERAFTRPNQADPVNPLMLQLRACLVENKNVIDCVYFRFVFRGNPEDADRSRVLAHQREQLEEKKYLITKFLQNENVDVIVDFRSSIGKSGQSVAPTFESRYKVTLADTATVRAATGEELTVGFMKLHDLVWMYKNLGKRFLDHNIRFGLPGDGHVNRSIARTLRSIVLDGSIDPSLFVFHHSGITLHAADLSRSGNEFEIIGPRLLNGAQTATTAVEFFDNNENNPLFVRNRETWKMIKVMCKIVANADKDFVTQITISNNRQNPVAPWNLHANDLIQLALQDKFRDDVGLYYERQERAFENLTEENLSIEGVQDSRPIQLLKLAQTFVLSDGNLSRISDLQRVFEEDKVYKDVFRPARLKADTRDVVLAYKLQFRLKKITDEIRSLGGERYNFVSKARSIIWALLIQGILNSDKISTIREDHGNNLMVSADFVGLAVAVARTRIKPILSYLISHPDFAEKVKTDQFSFLRTDAAFIKSMSYAKSKWSWTHRKLQ